MPAERAERAERAMPAEPAPTSSADALPPAKAPPASATPADPLDPEPVPTYRTLAPPAASLQYRYRRGLVRGHGELQWRPAADGYQLSLDIRADSQAPLLAQTSRGGFDAAGLAPLRFTDQRQRRPAAAANFQRDAGRITFSGPSTAYPLLPGSQDRLSTLLQLAAVVAGEPALRAPGARILLQVAGAHGEAAVWAFTRQDAASEGPADQLAYRKEPTGPYDLSVAVWLDPGNRYLPSRIVWRSSGDPDAVELQPLQDGTPRP